MAEPWPRGWHSGNAQPQHFTPTAGETRACLRTRIHDFLNAMQGTNILCVSHGVVIQTLLSILIGGPYSDHKAYEPENGAIHTVWFSDKNVCDYQTDRIA